MRVKKCSDCTKCFLGMFKFIVLFTACENETEKAAFSSPQAVFTDEHPVREYEIVAVRVVWACAPGWGGAGGSSRAPAGHRAGVFWLSVPARGSWAGGLALGTNSSAGDTGQWHRQGLCQWGTLGAHWGHTVAWSSHQDRDPCSAGSAQGEGRGSEAESRGTAGSWVPWLGQGQPQRQSSACEIQHCSAIECSFTPLLLTASFFHLSALGVCNDSC